MDTKRILATLRDRQASLEAHGAPHAALFRSRARGEARADSDIDTLVDIDPAFPMDVFQCVGVVHMIEDPFDARVDVSNRAAPRPHVRPAAERDAIYAF